MEKDLREAALEYHRWPTPGKISVRPTKGLTNQRDLALAYSPGVAAACDLIVEDPSAAAEMTSRANLVGVVTNVPSSGRIEFAQNTRSYCAG